MARRAREGVSPVSQLDELLPQADIVVVITPLTTETRQLMNVDRIARMKRGALLVNAARGEVVDTDALVQALNEKRIRAALDVTDPEPAGKDRRRVGRGWADVRIRSTVATAASVDMVEPVAQAVLAASALNARRPCASACWTRCRSQG